MCIYIYIYIHVCINTYIYIYIIGWHHLSNATCLIRTSLCSMALLV